MVLLGLNKSSKQMLHVANASMFLPRSREISDLLSDTVIFPKTVSFLRGFYQLIGFFPRKVVNTGSKQKWSFSCTPSAFSYELTWKFFVFLMCFFPHIKNSASVLRGPLVLQPISLRHFSFTQVVQASVPLSPVVPFF